MPRIIELGQSSSKVFKSNGTDSLFHILFSFLNLEITVVLQPPLEPPLTRAEKVFNSHNLGKRDGTAHNSFMMEELE